jgi:hypothetical protein
MLDVFGDESHDPKNERVFAVAALFGCSSCAFSVPYNSTGGRANGDCSYARRRLCKLRWRTLCLPGGRSGHSVHSLARHL